MAIDQNEGGEQEQQPLPFLKSGLLAATCHTRHGCQASTAMPTSTMKAMMTMQRCSDDGR
jgi:hypothetical protein